MIQTNECVACNSNSVYWFTKENQYGKYKIYKCPNCNSSFVSPRPDIKYLNDFYSQNSGVYKSISEIIEGEKNYPNSSLDAKRMVNNLISINKRKKGYFLDVGAGYGYCSKEAKANYLDVVSLEIGDFRTKALKELWDIEAVNLLFEDFTDDEGKYSYILMSQILEHTIDPDLWIKKAYKLLEAGGVICIAVPNFNSFFRYILGKRDIFIIPPEHLNFFSPEGLRIILKKNGFEIIKLDFISRLPFASRFSKNKLVKDLLTSLQNIFCKVIDKMKLGMFINVYARKI
jgi:2-polyprenyl-3-methyl-5-hydroxy-6-metoxy-1,4-benzoquinol methylase